LSKIQSLYLNVEVLNNRVAIEMRDTDEESVPRAAEELGINLSELSQAA
jgi:hypothetical protein